MNLGSDPADQVVRFSLQGTEVALKLSGLAAKNFALFLYAVFKDQKKTHGKTHLTRMLQEQRPLKFFTVPSDRMKEFAHEARKRGLLFVPIRNKNNRGNIEIVVFADDAAKVNRVLDYLNLDYVKAQAGDAAAQKSPEPERQPEQPEWEWPEPSPTGPESQTPSQTETVHTQDGEIEFEVGGFEDMFSMAGDAENFTPDRASDSDSPAKEKNPSGPSSNSSEWFPESGNNEPGRRSVKQDLKDIRQEKAGKKPEKDVRSPQHPNQTRAKKKKQTKGR